MAMKQRLKAALQSQPQLWAAYWRVKQELLRLWMLRMFVYDIGNTYRWMFWAPGSQQQKTLSAALLFQYHKLEKGMSMPGAKRLFGIDPATEVMHLLQRWQRAGHRLDDPVYLGALETLQALDRHLSKHGLDPNGRIAPRIQRFLAENPSRAANLVTPILLPALGASVSPFDGFSQLAQARRSVRDFSPAPVPAVLVHQAVALAQLSPSACNRQPCRVYAVTDAAQMSKLLSFQNGNRGFGDRIPTLLIITADEHCFFDASERHQPYVDGGLFSMSLCYALTAQGLATCCLNWCVPVANDKAVHRLAGIGGSERIVMFLAVGYPQPDCRVPKSPRRDTHSVLAAMPGAEGAASTA